MTVQFLTPDKYEWRADNYGRACYILDPINGDKKLAFHKGVTKILSAGEVSLKDKLVAQHGAAKAEVMQKEIFARGTAKHAKIEANHSELPTQLLKDLHEIVAKEVLVYSSDFRSKKVIGFMDAISVDNNGGYHIVDWKTKSSAFSFNKYSPMDAINKAYLQGVFYACLCKQLYNIEIQSVKIAVIFLNEDPYQLFTLERINFGSYVGKILEKLKY
jgi:ATP-dependent exoDNAse (exonuclease V) beta subunit